MGFELNEDIVSQARRIDGANGDDVLAGVVTAVQPAYVFVVFGFKGVGVLVVVAAVGGSEDLDTFIGEKNGFADDQVIAVKGGVAEDFIDEGFVVGRGVGLDGEFAFACWSWLDRYSLYMVVVAWVCLCALFGNQCKLCFEVHP